MLFWCAVGFEFVLVSQEWLSGGGLGVFWCAVGFGFVLVSQEWWQGEGVWVSFGVQLVLDLY